MSRALQLHRLVGRSLDNDELRTLCFDLGVDVENLPASTKDGRARELVLLLVRRGRLGELARELERLGLLAHRPACNPYLGLSTFDEQDASRFFGRDDLVETLVDRSARAPFIALLGPSGSGKSSVMRAGLVPALRAGRLPGSEEWCYARPIRPGPAPLRTLAAELLRLKGERREGRVTALRKRLARDPATFLDEIAMLLARQGATRLVLLVDQFEELWTLAPPDGREPFVALLVRALGEMERSGAASPLLLLATMRADFYGRALESHALADLISRHLVPILPMGPTALREAIVQPANETSVSFEEGLVGTLVEQSLDRKGMLPLLAYTLRVLWEEQSATGQIQWASYRALGGIEGALAERADGLLALHYTEEQREGLVRPLLLELVEVGDGVGDSRRRRRLSEMALPGCPVVELQRLLQPLVDERLLTTSIDDEEHESIELSHESLIRAWTSLSNWLEDARGDLQALRRLEAAALDWTNHGECDDYLWRGEPLQWALTWQRAGRLPPPTLVSAFLRASATVHEARQRASEVGARREAALARRSRRLAWSLALAVGYTGRGRSGRNLTVGRHRPAGATRTHPMHHRALRASGHVARSGQRSPPSRAALVYRYLTRGAQAAVPSRTRRAALFDRGNPRSEEAVSLPPLDRSDRGRRRRSAPWRGV